MLTEVWRVRLVDSDNQVRHIVGMYDTFFEAFMDAKLEIDLNGLVYRVEII